MRLSIPLIASTLLLPFIQAIPANLQVERWADDPSDSLPEGYVTTKGSQFWLDHYPYYFSGANVYWLSQLVHDSQYTQAFDELQELGVKVIRTWAFSQVEEVLPTNNLTYYQYWVNGTVFLNYGPNGLQRLDKTVAYAEKYGMKLILTLVNNWVDYGGMDVYIQQTTNATYMNETEHTDFYTYQPIIDLYESYTNQLVTRYKNSSAIFAWELANEPLTSSYPGVAAPNASAAEITQWVKDRSAYIKSLDSQHMVCIGDEGYYNWKNSTDNIYDGGSGEDFEADLAIETIDFGTFHLYPQQWAEGPIDQWGLDYIQQHINSQNNVGKPVVMEEFGVTGYSNQTTILPQWFKAAEDGGLGGIIPWQLGIQDIDTTDSTAYPSTNPGGLDGYDIYRNKTAIFALWKQAAVIMDAKSGKNAKS